LNRKTSDHLLKDERHLGDSHHSTGIHRDQMPGNHKEIPGNTGRVQSDDRESTKTAGEKEMASTVDQTMCIMASR
jgi:hypothetical protein